MDIHNRHALKAAACDALNAASGSPRRLVLLHAGVSAVVMLILTAGGLALQGMIDNTGGLAGLGTRSVLTTVQMLLQNAGTLLLPFWNFGYTFAVLALYRRQEAGVPTLLSGFRHFGPVIRFLLLKGLIFFGIGILCAYPSAVFYLLSPFSGSLVSALTADPALMDDPTALMENPAFADNLLPMNLIFLAVFLLVAAPMYYRLRMGEFALADDPKKGAFAALRSSSRMMRRNRLALLRLDVSFWWFYGLIALSAAITYGDVLLDSLGIALPIPQNTAYLLFYALGLLVQTAVYYFARNPVTLTYAAAYDVLRQPAPPPPTPVPQNLPWSY